MSQDRCSTPGCSEPLEGPEHHHPLLRHLTDWTRQVGEQPASRVAPGIAAASREFHAKLKALPTSTTLSESTRTFTFTTDQQQRGVGAYQQWKANVNNPASSASGGNLHDLARRMFEAMTNADPQEISAEASSRADGEASAAKKPSATASTSCQPGEAETPCGSATVAPSAGERSITVSADGQDELPPMVCIVRASGEGVTDWKLCRNESEIRTAYVEMVCGSDDEHHKEEIDGIMQAYRGDGWRGDTLKIDLYCASFTITRFPAECIAPSATASSERAWLIESVGGRRGTGYFWIGLNKYGTWGTIDEAVRFARKEDAERVIESLHKEDVSRYGYRQQQKYEACEHEWIGGTTKTAADSRILKNDSLEKP